MFLGAGEGGHHVEDCLVTEKNQIRYADSRGEGTPLPAPLPAFRKSDAYIYYPRLSNRVTEGEHHPIDPKYQKPLTKGDKAVNQHKLSEQFDKVNKSRKNKDSPGDDKHSRKSRKTIQKDAPGPLPDIEGVLAATASQPGVGDIILNVIAQQNVNEYKQNPRWAAKNTPDSSKNDQDDTGSASAGPSRTGSYTATPSVGPSSRASSIAASTGSFRPARTPIKREGSAATPTCAPNLGAVILDDSDEDK